MDPKTNGKPKILIIAEHRLYRTSLAHLVSCRGAVEVAGEAENAAQAVEQCQRLRPDVVLWDSSDGDKDFDALLGLHNRLRGTPLLVVSNHVSPALRPLIAAGLAGYLLKNASAEELLEAINRLRQGERFIDPGVKERVLDTMVRTRRRRSQESDLSRREVQVLRSIARGFTNVEIARHLRLGLKTVETYRSRLCKKLGLRTRADLVIYASVAGLVPPPHTGN